MPGGSPSNRWARAMMALRRPTSKMQRRTWRRCIPAAKKTLRPIFDELLALGRSMGADVKVCPCQTIVPLYRKHVFAQIKPTTRTRIDLGLALKDTKTPKRLIATGGFAKKDRITHRIEITSVKDIDAEVKKWLKTAYDMDR